MKVAAFIGPALQLSSRNTCRQKHRVIFDVRPHVQHTDFKPRGRQLSDFALTHDRAFRVVLMSSDLRSRRASKIGDMLVMISPLFFLGILLIFD